VQHFVPVRFSGLVGLVIAGALLAGCGTFSPADARAPVPQTNPEIRAAHLFTPKSGWVLTADRVLTTVNGGMTWADVTPRIIGTAGFAAPGSAPSQNARLLETAFFLNPTQAWAVVGGPAVTTACSLVPLDLFTTSDGGRHWSSRRMTATTQCDTPGPVYLTFIDSMRGWLIVDQGSNANFMKFDGFRTADGGVTWTKMAYPQSAPLLFVDPKDGFSVGAGDAQSGAYGTHDGGRTWKRLALNGSFSELPAFSNEREGVLAGQVMDPSGGTASVAYYSTNDAGKSWRLSADVRNPDSRTSAQSLGIVNAASWLAAFLVAGPVRGATYTRLKATRDGGRTWEWLPATVPGAFEGQVSFAGATGWGVLVDAGCRGFKTDCYTNWSLVRTVDAGAHWTRLPVS
jgi:photosystem II stability/assembly factor-like uncharacterized protein